MVSQYLSLFDIISSLFWLGILLFIGHFHYLQNKEKPHYKYYLWNIYGKFFFAIAFSIFYVAITQGGDTVAYFDGASVLNNLFVHSPSDYLQELFSPPNTNTVFQVYSAETGYPPGWIYKEPEAFFICKLISLFSFLTFKSYLASTLIIAFISAHASWKLFTLILEFKLAKPIYVALAVLFLPSVNFWCTGISKDSFVYIGLCYMIYFGFKYLHFGILKVTDLLTFFICAWLIYHIRSVVLLIVIIPFALAFISRGMKRIGLKNFAVGSIRTLFLFGSFTVVIFSQGAKTEEEFLSSSSLLQEAAVTQNDFAQNESYGDSRYDLGLDEFTFTGLLRVTPLAIFTGAFRPLFYEALSPNLILNGLESLLLIFGLLRFVVIRPLAKYRFIRGHEFLYFCLIFVLLLSFMTGLTSGLYGVLVRLRAPLLPFLFLLLNVDYSNFYMSLNHKKQARGTV